MWSVRQQVRLALLFHRQKKGRAFARPRSKLFHQGLVTVKTVVALTLLALSITMSWTVVLAAGNEAHDPAATVALNEPPLLATGDPVIVTPGSEAVTLYGGTPPVITKDLDPPAVHPTTPVVGTTEIAGAGGGACPPPAHQT